MEDRDSQVRLDEPRRVDGVAPGDQGLFRRQGQHSVGSSGLSGLFQCGHVSRCHTCLSLPHHAGTTTQREFDGSGATLPGSTLLRLSVWSHGYLFPRFNFARWRRSRWRCWCWYWWHGRRWWSCRWHRNQRRHWFKRYF